MGPSHLSIKKGNFQAFMASEKGWNMNPNGSKPEGKNMSLITTNNYHNYY